MENLRKQILLERNIKLAYIQRMLLFGGTSFAISTITILWADNGVSLKDGLFLQAIFGLVFAFLDVPTGYLADTLGRKKSMLAGAVFYTIGEFCYFSSYSFNGFLISEILLAFGFSLLSGADQAILYDSLSELSREDEFESIWGKGWSYSLFSIALCTPLGGIITSSFSARASMFPGFIFGLVLIFITIFFTETTRPVKTDRIHDHLSQILSIGRHCLLENQRIRWLVIFSAFVFGINQTAFWLYQPYFRKIGLPVAAFGFMYALYNLFAGLIARNIYLIRQKTCEISEAMRLLILLGGSFLAMGWTSASVACLLPLCHQTVRGYLEVIFSGYLNSEVDSQWRATVISLKSMATRISCSLMFVGMGYMMVSEDVTLGLHLLAPICLAGGLLLIGVFFSRRGRLATEETPA